MVDFANILFAGPCSARCYFCIGQLLNPDLNPSNLDLYPPRNLEAFVALVWEHAIRQVVFTGTTTDPQLYHHEARLLDHLRQALPAGTQFSLHTNGRQALRQMAVFNQYDRVCVSFPSFSPSIYQAIMGVQNPPDLAEILRQTRVPVKVSCLTDHNNAVQIPVFLSLCQEIGVQRLVLRKLFGDQRTWGDLLTVVPEWSQRGAYRGNPVYDYQGMEVTLWDFDRTESTSINLFANGTLSTEYLLAAAQATSHVS